MTKEQRKEYNKNYYMARKSELKAKRDAKKAALEAYAQEKAAMNKAVNAHYEALYTAYAREEAVELTKNWIPGELSYSDIYFDSFDLALQLLGLSRDHFTFVNRMITDKPLDKIRVFALVYRINDLRAEHEKIESEKTREAKKIREALEEAAEKASREESNKKALEYAKEYPEVEVFNERTLPDYAYATVDQLQRNFDPNSLYCVKSTKHFYVYQTECGYKKYYVAKAFVYN